MSRAKYVLEFLAAMDEEDFERVRRLWDGHSSDITRRLNKGEALEVYSLFDSHGMIGERDRLYNLATKYAHPAAQDLIAAKHVRYVR